MQTSGKILLIKPTQNISEKFRKREFVLQIVEDERHPQPVLFELHQERCKLLDKFKEGDYLAVFFNLKGRTWDSPSGEKKYFNTLNVWKLHKIEKLSPNRPKQTNNQ